MGLFGLFEKKAKKKSHVPEYDARLIPKFHHEHKELIAHIGKIHGAMDQGALGTGQVKKLLKSLKMELLGHFMEEDIKLYWYLKEYYKEEPTALSIVRSFEESIKEIQKDIMHFFDYYSRDDVALDDEYIKQFTQIVDELSIRINSEEENLYPLYVE
jgi:iron-sulfur cluster repair protein YtfE (RIC family)